MLYATNLHLKGNQVEMISDGDIIDYGSLVGVELHTWRRDEYHRVFHHDQVRFDIYSCHKITTCVIEDAEATKLFDGICNYLRKKGLHKAIEFACAEHYGDSPDSFVSWYEAPVLIG